MDAFLVVVIIMIVAPPFTVTIPLAILFWGQRIGMESRMRASLDSMRIIESGEKGNTHDTRYRGCLRKSY